MTSITTTTFILLHLGTTFPAHIIRLHLGTTFPAHIIRLLRLGTTFPCHARRSRGRCTQRKSKSLRGSLDRSGLLTIGANLDLKVSSCSSFNTYIMDILSGGKLVDYLTYSATKQYLCRPYFAHLLVQLVTSAMCNIFNSTHQELWIFR